jgi:hypothetical protein
MKPERTAYLLSTFDVALTICSCLLIGGIWGGLLVSWWPW